MISGLDPRLERRLRFLLRAFPRRYREARADEILSTVADSAPIGCERPDLRTAFDLVRAGWSERIRQHPPLWRWLWYRTLGGKLPPQYYPWLLDDVRGLLFATRKWLGLMAPIIVMADPRSTARIFSSRFLESAGLFHALVLLTVNLMRNRLIVKTLEQHGIDVSGFMKVEFATGTSTHRYQDVDFEPRFHALGATRSMLVLGLVMTPLFTAALVAHSGRAFLDSGDLVYRESFRSNDRPWIAITLIAAVGLLLASTASLRRVWRRMMQLEGDTDLVVRRANWGEVMGAVFATFVMYWLSSSYVIPPFVLVLALCGLGPALLVLGVRAWACERRLGVVVPLPFVRTRYLVHLRPVDPPVADTSP